MHRLVFYVLLGLFAVVPCYVAASELPGISRMAWSLLALDNANRTESMDHRIWEDIRKAFQVLPSDDAILQQWKKDVEGVTSSDDIFIGALAGLIFAGKIDILDVGSVLARCGGSFDEGLRRAQENPSSLFWIVTASFFVQKKLVSGREWNDVAAQWASKRIFNEDSALRDPLFIHTQIAGLASAWPALAAAYESVTKETMMSLVGKPRKVYTH